MSEIDNVPLKYISNKLIFSTFTIVSSTWNVRHSKVEKRRNNGDSEIESRATSSLVKKHLQTNLTDRHGQVEMN